MNLIVARAALKAVPREVWLILAVVAMMAGAIWWAYDEGRDSRALEVQALEGRVAELTAANQSIRRTVKALEDANQELAEGRAADAQEAQRLLDMMREEALKARQALERERRNRSRIYEQNPQAAQWADTRVPDGVVDSLR